jgi:hypothetical protein
MRLTGGQTGVAVTRARDYCGVLRRLRVLVDGEEIGDVAYGQRGEFALEPGVYSLQVAMDWCRSEPYEVHVCPGEVVELNHRARKCREFFTLLLRVVVFSGYACGGNSARLASARPSSDIDGSG